MQVQLKTYFLFRNSHDMQVQYINSHDIQFNSVVAKRPEKKHLKKRLGRRSYSMASVASQQVKEQKTLLSSEQIGSFY